jgi:C-terminal processing protease CtpA/Prc
MIAPAIVALLPAVSIVRDEIKLEDQQAKARIVDLPWGKGGAQRIGVIDLPGFYGGEPGSSGPSATKDVARLLKKLKEENVTGIILDIRRNGGGSLDEAINRLIGHALKQTGDNVSAAARLLGVSRDYVRYRLENQKTSLDSGE